MAWWEGLDKVRIMIAPGYQFFQPYALMKDKSKDLNIDSSATVDDPGRLLLFRHPKSGNATCYLFVAGMLHELQWFKQKYGSWFLGDYISEDGSLYMATPVDPVFILLPIFEEARMKKRDDPGMFRQLGEIMFIDGYPAYQHLLLLAENCMQVVCETKDFGSTTFYRLDDSKVLAWLHHKVSQLKRTLPTLDPNYAAQDKKDTLADAVSILGEYLPMDPWLKLLCNHLGIDILEATRKENYTEDHSTAVECTPEPPSSLQEKKSVKKLTQSRKQTKNPNVQIDSRNIREMFSRACKKKS